MTHELHCYEYINQPYATVRAALRSDMRGILARATNAATGRGDTLAAHLRVELGALEVGTEVAIAVVRATESPSGGADNTPATIFELRWKAARSAALFPAMQAELVVYPLAKDQTQLELRGVYHPPLGPLGAAFDGVLGHRLAEESVRCFVRDIADLLKSELRSPAQMGAAATA